MKTREMRAEFLGKTYNFNVPENIKIEDFIEIADMVEKKFIRIKREAGDLDSFKLGLLAAINTAEEYFCLKKENERLKAVLTKIDRLLPPVDNNIRPGMVKEDQMPILFQLE